MAIDNCIGDTPVTQVGSALHQMREIYSRLRFLEENPELLRQEPDVYIHLGNDLMALFTNGCERDAWNWYSQNSNKLGKE